MPIGTTALAARLPLWLQAQTAQVTGQTDYNGYLQTGNTLTPYRAKTGNTWRSHSVALGVPLTWSQAPHWQVVPYVQWASAQWQRNLVQYGETYRYRSTGLGLLLQWAVTYRLTFEAGAARRRQSLASVAVPAFDFAAQQGRGIETELSAAARWQLGSRWHVQASAASTRFRNGDSPVVQGLQAPPNTHRPLRYALGVGFVY